MESVPGARTPPPGVLGDLSNSDPCRPFAMAVFTVWLFSEDGRLLFYREWNRRKHTRSE